MHPTNKTARVAGFLYVFMGLTGAFSLMYVPRTLIVRGDATATANNILASETLFRIGIISGLVSGVAFIFLARALYRLFHGVSNTQASLMVTLVLISVAIGFVNEVNNLAALSLFRGADFLGVFDKPQREALGMLFLRLNGQGSVVNEIFGGLWLLPFGLLVIRSGFLPRILGALLIVNGFAYVAVSFFSLLLPTPVSVLNPYVFVALLGELWIMLWLLIKGVRVEPVAAAVS